MAVLTQSPNITDLKSQEDVNRYIQLFLQGVQDVINGRLSLADNNILKKVGVDFTAADTDTVINHGLSRAPRGYFVISRTAGMIVYDGSKASTVTQITLKSSAIGTAQIVFL